MTTAAGNDSGAGAEKPEAVVAPVEAAATITSDPVAFRQTFTEAESSIKPGNLRATSVYPTDTRADFQTDKTPLPGSTMDRIIHGDNSPEALNPYEGRDKTVAILEKSGMTRTQAEDYTNQIEARLAQNGLKPEEVKAQMARLNRAFDSMLAPGDRVVNNGDIGANNPSDLSVKDRQNLVKDFAMRLANPEMFANQGAHNTCALTSMAKLALQGKDPAKLAEQVASVVNNKFAMVTSPDGTTVQRVNIDGRSLVPDNEARIDPMANNGNKTRGMAGQVMDALLGQMSADAQGALDGKKYVYLAANAGDLTGNRRSSTGEGMFENVGGNLKFLDDSPQMTLVAKAQLSRMLDLPKGINFIHTSMLNEIPPQFRDQFTEFSSAEDLKAKFALFSAETGFKSAEVRVNAPFLPGEVMAGHGLHSVNISMGKDANGKPIVMMDNHWGNGKDKPLTDNDVNLATDSTKWGNYPRAFRHGEPTTPGNIIEAPSNHLRLPNETDDAYAKRMTELRAEQDKANQDRLEQLKQQKNIVDPTSTKGKEIQTEMENIQAMKDAYQKAFQQYEQELSAWNLNKRAGLAPSLSTILSDTLGGVRFK